MLLSHWPGFPEGFYNLTVSNSDGLNVTGEDLFYVTDQAWISKAPKMNSPPVVRIPGFHQQGK